MKHVTGVQFQRAWNEWRPECSCGWIGSYWLNRDRAMMEADEHKEKNG